MKIKKILVPIDFSDNSLVALKYAAGFAKASGSELIMLHVTDPDSLENELRGNLDPAHLISLLEKEDYLSGIKCHSELVKGNISQSVLDLSKKYQVDLIVMGTRGAGNASRLLVGTKTTHVIARSDCPVLVVPVESTYKPIRKVVMAVDMEQRNDKIIEEVINLIKEQQAAILLAYVGKDHDSRFERELQDLVSEIKGRTGYHRLIGKVIHAADFPVSITGFINDIEADMLVMITHHRGIFEAIFDPSQTKQFAYHTKTPVMAIPHHRNPVFFL